MSLGLCLIGSMLLDTAVRSADLMEVYELAKSNDPVFQSATFAFEAARQKRSEAFAALLPSVSATADGNRTSGSTAYSGTPAVTRSFYADDWTLQLTQPVVRPGNVFAYDEARSFVEAASDEFAAAQQDLMVRVAGAYFDVLVAEETVLAADAQLRSMREQLNAAQSGFQRGVASVTDADDARSREALAQAQRTAAVANLEVHRAALEAITGPVSTPLAGLGASVTLSNPVPDDLGTWVARSGENNLNVRGAQATLAAAEHELSRVRSLRLPSLDLVATYGGNHSSGNVVNPVNYSTDVRDVTVGLQFSVPIFEGGALSAQVGEARAKWKKAGADLEAARRQAAQEVKQSYTAVQSGIAEVAALRAAVDAGSNTVKGAQAGYGLGIRINSDVLNAEQQLYGTKRDLAKARYDTLLAGLKLKAATGDLRASDLQAMNGLLVESPTAVPQEH